MMVPHEDHQITTEGDADGLPGGAGGAADLCPPLQPSKVHPTPDLRRAGPQRVLPLRLPEGRRAAQRLRRFAPGDRAGIGPTLHDPSESLGAAVGPGQRPATSQGHGRSGAEKKLLGKRLKNAAIDSTGLEERQTSHHFRTRKEETEKSAGKKPKKSPFPKLALLCDCATHLTLSLQADRGPGADHKYFKPLLDQAARDSTIARLLADAGFDSEAHHEYARRRHGVVALIPPIIGRPTAKPPTGRHRRRMKARWETFKKHYGQRWQVETVNSMLKRLLGSFLRAITYWNRCREMALRVLTLNIMILAPVG